MKWWTRPAPATALRAGSSATWRREPELTAGAFRRAMFYGGVMGSFAVEQFGTERLERLTREEIDARFEQFRELTHLD